jgi:hypothetical protein
MLPAEWEKHEQQGWVEEALQRLEEPPQLANKPQPLLDLLGQGLDTRGLVTVVLFLLNHMPRKPEPEGNGTRPATPSTPVRVRPPPPA